MSKGVIFLYLLLIPFLVRSQFSIPYINNFDSPGDTIGWSHYGLLGSIDDWEFGIPNKYIFTSAYSQPNAWVTDLDSNCVSGSLRVLETPYFNLMDTSVDYALSFYQKRHSSTNSGGYYSMEYSIDHGNTWIFLNDSSAQKYNWQGLTGFPGYSLSFQKSSIDLSFIQGQDSVKFRFRFQSINLIGAGWMIDDFSIKEEYFNIYAVNGDTISVSQNCVGFEIKTPIGFDNQYFENTYITTNYYLSVDSIFDNSDSLIGSKSANIWTDWSNWTQQFTMIPNLSPGNYYLFYNHDALDTLKEDNENDNIGFSLLKVDTVYNLPYIDDFEGSHEVWKVYKETFSQMLFWELGNGYTHHLEGTHSGIQAWHTCKSKDFKLTCSSNCNKQYLETPYYNIPVDSLGTVLNFWYKKDANPYGAITKLQYTNNCGEYWLDYRNIPYSKQDDWDYINIRLDTFAPINSIKFRISFASNIDNPEGIILDDFYIGIPKADLTIERDKFNRFSASNSNFDTLHYYLFNSGLSIAPQSITSFYWSPDSIFDPGDVFIGSKQEQSLNDSTRIWTSFSFQKPTTTPGKYYIFYNLDSSNIIDEMREYDNNGYFVIYLETPIPIPYYNDFETQINGWRHNSSLGEDDWQWTTPKGTLLDSAFSGANVWISSDTGMLSPMSRMHLYTPVFDFTNTINPVLEIDMKIDIGYTSLSSLMNMSYSIDGGANWEILNTSTVSSNRWYQWYKFEPIPGKDVLSGVHPSNSFFDIFEQAFPSYFHYNSRDADRLTKYINDISFLAGNPNVQFRFNLASLKNSPQLLYFSQREGALIDNFSIKEAFIDLNVTYQKSLMISSLNQKIKFFMHIKNQGNYITTPSISHYYLSTDTILDATDYFLGMDTLPEISPDLYHYVNYAFNSPVNLSQYQYLIYKLDATNTNLESDETNNIGYWMLALDSIKTYPYVNDFNDSIINGWYQCSIAPYTNEIGSHRFRNMLAPAEPIYSTGKQSGEWFTELGNNYLALPPTYYLESPAFNFKNVDSIFLSFDLFCMGKNHNSPYYREGGNFQYSIDGGNVWTVLTTEHGNAHRWYDTVKMGQMDNEPGWITAWPMDSSSIDISFLKGKENVVFRFKHRSNAHVIGISYPHGMRIDNFKLQGFTVDYVALDNMSSISASPPSPEINVDYKISNIGESQGRITTTKFYWSSDSIYDASDSLIKTVTENPILFGTTANLTVTIPYPQLNQSTYYLFYQVDADSNLHELDETNNVGSFIVSFPLNANYTALNKGDTINLPYTATSFNTSYSFNNNGLGTGSNSITKFYWSSDSTFDAADVSIQTFSQGPVSSGDTVTGTANMPIPLPVSQSLNYLFYKLDNNDDLIEYNEDDNIGYYIIVIDTALSVKELMKVNGIAIYLHSNNIYIYLPKDMNGELYNIKMINIAGQLVLNTELSLSTGTNKIELPGNLASGIYLIYLYNSSSIYTTKGVIQVN